MVDWVKTHGAGVLVPWVSHRKEKDFYSYVKDKNGSIPWFELANGEWGADGLAAPVWRSREYNLQQKHSFPASTGKIQPNKRLGFIANELLDPVGCNGAALEHCKDSLCKASWPLSYVVHHCQNTWRGRIGTT